MYSSDVSWRAKLALVIAGLAMMASGCKDELVTSTSIPSFDLVGGNEVAAVFTVTNPDNGGAGSLRQAITDANASPGTDGIVFAIPGAGPHVIALASALPFVTDPVVIDGFSQPGASANSNASLLGTNARLKIAINGSAAGGTADGLTISANETVVRGLAIYRFRHGVLVAGNGNRLEGNFVGVGIDGTTAAPNLGSGVRIVGSDNVVGGDAASRNVISGNRGDGVLITGFAAVQNRVEGNYVGVDATATVAIPNGLPEPSPVNSAGVHITGSAASNVVGGQGAMPATCDGPCNVISGNHRSGVWIEGQAHHNVVQGNLIGTDARGTLPLGNTRFGVFLGIAGTTATYNTVSSNRIQWNGRDGVGLGAGASGNVVGGLGVSPGACDGPCNVISFNGLRLDTRGAGVRLFAAAGVLNNSVLGNSISSNPNGLGIALGLGPDSVTANDPGDLDVGANGLQNFPLLTAAHVTAGRLVVRGTVDTPAPERVLVEIFANQVPVPGGDPSGHGEGAVFLGRAVPDARGAFSAHLAPVPPGALITATATDADGNTSEFAANVRAMPDRGPKDDQDSQFVPFSLLAATCEEFVEVTGSIRIDDAFTSDGSGGFHFRSQMTVMGVGIGTSTGDLYNLNHVMHQGGSFGAAETFTFVTTLNLIGRGGTADYQFRAAFHMTVTPDGVARITVDRFSETCG